MNELIQKVETWGFDKGLDKTSKVAQMQKLLEEFAETVSAYNKKDIPEIKDGIGDVLVVLVISTGTQHGFRLNVQPKPYDVDYASALESLAALTTMVSQNRVNETVYQTHAGFVIKYIEQYADEYGWTLYECLDTAYNVIKDRKGKTTKDGGFIKDEPVLEKGE